MPPNRGRLSFFLWQALPGARPLGMFEDETWTGRRFHIATPDESSEGRHGRRRAVWRPSRSALPYVPSSASVSSKWPHSGRTSDITFLTASAPSGALPAVSVVGSFAVVTGVICPRHRVADRRSTSFDHFGRSRPLRGLRRFVYMRHLPRAVGTKCSSLDSEKSPVAVKI